MSYGLKYIASFESEPLGYYYEIKILERDYTGKASKRNLGGAPELRKDNNGAICGTSLEFLLETTFNGDLREFYTEDNKKLKVEVWRDGILFWVGFVVTEVYEEEMSYMSDIAIRATDGLGLLKTEDYDLTGEQLIWSVIKYCADKSGLILGWDVRTSIQRKSPAESILQSCKINAEIFNDRKNCYEVLTDLLNTLGCYITQSRGNWVISHYVKDSQIGFFTPDFGKRTDISRDSYSFSIGTIDSPDAFSFPVGSLTMSVEPSRKELAVIQQYKTYPSFFANWNFADQSAWSGSGQYVEIDAVNCRYIPGILDKFSECFTQVVNLANSVGSSFYLEVKYAVITNNVNADHEIKIVLKQAYNEGVPIELTANGWLVSPAESDRMNLHVEKLSGRSGKIEWNTFKIYANGLAGSGDLTIELYNARGKANNDSYVGVYYAEVRAMVEIPGEVEKKIPFNTKASESEDVKLAFGDAYSVENTENITANAIRTGTEVAKGNWMINTIDNISGSFHHVLSVLYANRYNKARRKLEGTLLCKGKIPELCLESNFYYTEDKKDYRAISGEMNLLTDEISVELLEIYYPKALPAVSALQSVRSADVTDGTYRAAGPMEYRTYQAGTTESEPKMIRELDRVQDNEVGTDSLLEIDTIIPKKSKSVSLGQLKRCLLGEWFYEKDGRLFCKLDFISEGGVSAYGSGPEGGGLTVDLVDNLISTRTDAALTANMGRYLKSLIDGKASSWNTIIGKPSVFPTNWDSVAGKPDFSKVKVDNSFAADRLSNKINNLNPSDCNTVNGGGTIYNYGGTSYWRNAPSGMSYGSVFQLNSIRSNDLALQLAADVNHNVSASTRRLWFRTANNLGFQNDWKEVFHSGNANLTSVSWSASLINFPEMQFNVNAAPRTTLPPMSIKLWDSYNQSIGTGTTYATVLQIYGKVGHWDNQIAFDGFNGSIYYRNASYNSSAYCVWRKLWDSDNHGPNSGLNADLLDGYHRHNLYNGLSDFAVAVGNVKSIIVDGDRNTYYPVVITGLNGKYLNNIVSITKDLDSQTPDWPNNHNNGTSSCLYRYDFRYMGWDGNGGFIRTLNAWYGYATVCAHTSYSSQINGGLIIWLRGGGAQYYISCTNRFNVNIYYSRANLGNNTHQEFVEPRTTIGNAGRIATHSFPVWSELEGVSGIRFTGTGHYRINEYGNFQATSGSTSNAWNVCNTAGSSVLYVNADWGRIGVCTGDPQYVLDINGGLGARGIVSIGSENTYTTISGQIGSPVNGVVAKYSVKWYNDYWEWLYYRGGSADIQNIVLALNGTQKYRFDRAGNFLATGEITAYSASDRRLKENIKNLTGRASNFLRKLNPVEFDWNDTAMKLNPSKRRHDYSFLADEYGEVFPFAVSTIYEKYQSIDTKILLPLLVAGHNETATEIDRLKNRIQVLERKIRQIKR